MREGDGLAKRRGGGFPQFVGEREHLRADEDRVGHPSLGDRLGQLAMERLAEIAQFLHAAQHRDAAGGGGRGERLQRRAHRCRVGVVAFVDQQRLAAAGQAERMTRAAAFQAAHFGQRQARTRQIAACRAHCRHDAE